jgi:hypothetical protein
MADLDLYGLKGVPSVWSTDVTGTFSANTWYDTGFHRDVITSTYGGSGNVYMLFGYLNLYSSGFGSMYSGQFVSAPFHLNTNSTNSVARCDLAIGTLLGHAPNEMGDGYDRDEKLQFSFKHEYSNNQNGWRLQFLSTVGITLDNTSGKDMNLWVKRVL